MKIKESKIYYRLFVNYLLAILFLIVTLDFYFINRFLNSSIDRNIYINEKVVYDVNEAVSTISNSSNEIIENMYSDLDVLDDILYFMQTDNLSYLKNKLDKFSKSNNNYYNGIERFVASSFRLNENLEEISFVSYDRLTKSSFNSGNQIKTVNVNSKDVLLRANAKDIYTDKNIIEIVKEVRDPINLRGKGLIVLQYNFNKLRDIYRKYEHQHKILIVDESFNTIFSSDNEFNYEEAKLKETYYVSERVNPLGITAVAQIAKNKARELPAGLIRSVILVDIIVLLIALAMIYAKLQLLGDRTDKILVAMNEVKNGNLEVQIPLTSHNDEINYISENFNSMCRDLDHYVKKVYLSQVEQKKAEMIALQNQINPHFLYNTLESIRMKAISNGDREVGKMLYTLSFLFRMQVKDKDIITLKDELNYCEKYIDIFKFRYDDHFNFEINCPKELDQCKTIKFSIQPIIENYFIHGIRLEDYDNRLIISASKENKDVFIKVIDNGRGMDKADMDMVNDRLGNEPVPGGSIGLSNVHQRSVNEYGEGYGVALSQNSGGGITVTIKSLCEEVYNV